MRPTRLKPLVVVVFVMGFGALSGSCRPFKGTQTPPQQVKRTKGQTQKVFPLTFVQLLNSEQWVRWPTTHEVLSLVKPKRGGGERSKNAAAKTASDDDPATATASDTDGQAAAGTTSEMSLSGLPPSGLAAQSGVQILTDRATGRVFLAPEVVAAARLEPVSKGTLWIDRLGQILPPGTYSQEGSHQGVVVDNDESIRDFLFDDIANLTPEILASLGSREVARRLVSAKKVRDMAKNANGGQDAGFSRGYELRLFFPKVVIASLTSGFKNYWQTGKTGGFDSSERLAKREQTEKARLHPELGFSSTDEIFDFLRPKYAQVHDNRIDYRDVLWEDPPLEYGKVIAVLADQVQERALWTKGDSLRLRESENRSFTFPAQPNATEAMIFGRLDLRDVKHFIVPKGFKINDLDAYQRLEGLGLPIYDYEAPEPGLKQPGSFARKSIKPLVDGDVSVLAKTVSVAWQQEINDRVAVMKRSYTNPSLK